MNSFLVALPLGNIVVMGKNAVEAWSKAMCDEIKLGDTFVTREELINRGYTTLEKTHLDNVFELIKN